MQWCCDAAMLRCSNGAQNGRPGLMPPNTTGSSDRAKMHMTYERDCCIRGRKRDSRREGREEAERRDGLRMKLLCRIDCLVTNESNCKLQDYLSAHFLKVPVRCTGI